MTCWWWYEVTPFLAYLAKFGRKWTTTQETLKKSILDKCWNEIPPSTSPSWNTIWHKHKAHKEATFLQLIIHKVVAVNKWRGQSLVEIDMNCPHCGQLVVQLVKHIFVQLHASLTSSVLCN